MNLINLAEGREKRQARVNTVINFGPYNYGNFFTSCGAFSFS